MKDSIQIKGNKIIANISVVVKQKNDVYIGYIPSFDLPFTSPTKEKVSEIASGLISTLFNMWLKRGNLNLLKEKLEKYKFSQKNTNSNFIAETSSPTESLRIHEELYVA